MVASQNSQLTDRATCRDIQKLFHWIFFHFDAARTSTQIELTNLVAEVDKSQLLLLKRIYLQFRPPRFD